MLAEYRYDGGSMHTLSLPNLFEENHSPKLCNSGRDKATCKVLGRRILIENIVRTSQELITDDVSAKQCKATPEKI